MYNDAIPPLDDPIKTMFLQSIPFSLAIARISSAVLSKKLLEVNKNVKIIGLDSVNDYYEVSLKKYRLNILSKYNNFTFINFLQFK